MPPTLTNPPRRLTLDEEKLRLICFGDAGVGKTTLAATFPRPLFIDSDYGLISIAVQGFEPLVFDVNGFKDLEGLYFWSKEHINEFDTIVFDSGNTLSRLLLDEIHAKGVEKDKLANKAVDPMMIFVPEQGEYQANQRQMFQVLNDFRRLGKHMVVTFGVREHMGKRVPDASPGLLTILNHWSSVVGELVVVEKEGEEPYRALVTKASRTRAAKSRFSSLLPYVKDPKYQTIWDRVTEEYKKAKPQALAGKQGKTDG